MKIPTQIWIFCVGIFLQHYTFLQKRTFCILCEKFFHFVRKATAGHEAQLEAKNVLLKPIENMSLVVNHISDTLDTVIGNGYYKDVFTGFENLSHLF